MIPLVLAAIVSYDFTDRPIPESTARQCAEEVGIPYASDNFTDTEWREFQRCVIYQTTP